MSYETIEDLPKEGGRIVWKARSTQSDIPCTGRDFLGDLWCGFCFTGRVSSASDFGHGSSHGRLGDYWIFLDDAGWVDRKENPAKNSSSPYMNTLNCAL
jgi:hypothetical protein